MKPRLLAAVASLASFAISTIASAIPVTWTFEATVRLANGIPDSLASLGVGVGAQVTGFVRFESSTADDRPDKVYSGAYLGTVQQVGMTVGDWSIARGLFAPDPASTTNDTFVSVENSTFPGEFMSSDMYDPTGSFTYFVLWALEMSEHGSTIWTTDAQLIDPPALANLDPYGLDNTTPWGYGTDIALFADNRDGASMELRAEITSLQRVGVTPPLPLSIPGDVPEPEVLGLLALSGLALLRLRR